MRKDQIDKKPGSPEALDALKAIELDLLIHSPTEHRAYVGMSGIGGCLLKQWLNFKFGQVPSLSGAKYGTRGYMFEANAKVRLERIGLYVPGSEMALVAPWDDRFRGHTDGATKDGMLLELKSIKEDAFQVVVNKDQPKPEHMAQVQTYMLYGQWEACLVVYIETNTLNHWPLLVKRNTNIGVRMEQRARTVLEMIDSNTPPLCECNFCRIDRRVIDSTGKLR